MVLRCPASRPCVSPSPKDSTNASRHDEERSHAKAQSRKENASSDLCVSLNQRFDERLTPPRRKISRKGAKPQRNRMVLRCPASRPLVQFVGHPRRVWSGLDPVNSFLARPAPSEISPPSTTPRTCPHARVPGFTHLANSTQSSLAPNARERILRHPLVRGGREGL